MKIKRYIAPSMRAALSMVRAEQGSEAVILSSRRGEQGVEVIAAVDYDAALFAAAKRQKAFQSPEPAAEPVNRPQPGSATQVPPPAPPPGGSRAREAASPSGSSPHARPASPARTPAPTASAARTSPAQPLPASAAGRTTLPVAAPTLIVRPPAARAAARALSTAAPAPPASRTFAPTPSVTVRPPSPARADVPPATASAPVSAAGSAAGATAELPVHLMQRELREMRQLLERGLAGMTWNDKRLREPLRAQVLDTLSQMDIAPDVALGIAARTPLRSSLRDPRNIPLALLVKSLSFAGDDTPATGGIAAIVGPTGAGKTTTIAKLAARWCLEHGNHDVALISADAHRIGAREQLMTFARLLDVDMFAANSGRELARLVSRLDYKKLILIDTAGMGPRDARLPEHLSVLRQGALHAKVLLALPATQEATALDAIVRAYATAHPAACIITKVDEAASLGGVLSAVIRHRLNIAYLCNGQRVPDDLHASPQRRVWLVRAAQELKKGEPRVRDEAYLARTFGGMPAHA